VLATTHHKHASFLALSIKPSSTKGWSLFGIFIQGVIIQIRQMADSSKNQAKKAQTGQKPNLCGKIRGSTRFFPQQPNPKDPSCDFSTPCCA
jgi:hypothetical protein